MTSWTSYPSSSIQSESDSRWVRTGKRQVVAPGKWRERTRLQSIPSVPLSGSTGADFGAHVGPPPPWHPSQFPRRCSQTRNDSPGPSVVNFAGALRSQERDIFRRTECAPWSSCFWMTRARIRPKQKVRNERGLDAMTRGGMESGGKWVSEMFKKQGNNKTTQGVFLRNRSGAKISYIPFEWHAEVTTSTEARLRETVLGPLSVRSRRAVSLSESRGGPFFCTCEPQ